MTISQQNVVLPHLGADLRPAQPERIAPKWIMPNGPDGVWQQIPHTRNDKGDRPADQEPANV